MRMTDILHFDYYSLVTNDQPHPNPTQLEATIPSDKVGLALILLAFVVVFVAVINSQPLQSANDRSRWCTVWSLVERGTYQIDEVDGVSEWSTIDKVRHRTSTDDPWHFYSSKPPLFPTVVAGLYWLERHTLGYGLQQHTAFVTRLLLVVVNALPFLAALLSLRRSLRHARITDRTRWFILVAAGFGSMLTPFLTTLNNHTPAAICVMFCLAALIRIKSAETPAAGDFGIVGFTAALTCCLELPAALFGLLTFVLLVKNDWNKTARVYVPAALIPLAAFFVTNWICTGEIRPFYAYYGTEKYVYVHDGVPSYWSQPQGIDANDESSAVYLFHCVLGHHGLLAITPVFLLTGIGWVIGLYKDRRSMFRAVWWLGAGFPDPEFLSVSDTELQLRRQLIGTALDAVADSVLVVWNDPGPGKIRQEHIWFPVGRGIAGSIHLFTDVFVNNTLAAELGLQADAAGRLDQLWHDHSPL